MAYFDYLPNIAYPNGVGGSLLSKNILTRAKVIDALRNEASSALEYLVRDGERPETIAHRVYGRSDYHWLILLFNEIHDPFFSWPMSANELEKHLEASYPGKCLFVDPVGLMDVDSGEPLDRRIPHFGKGDLIRQRNENGSVIASAEVYSWNPDLYMVTVSSVSGVFALQGEAARNSSVISDRSVLTRDLSTVNSEGRTIEVPLVRITDDERYALRRFENASQETVSPWFRPKGSTVPLIDRYVLGRQETVPMGVDDGGEELGNATIVTNIEHEERINDGKRAIRVMRPEYIDLVLRDFRRLF